MELEPPRTASYLGSGTRRTCQAGYREGRGLSNGSQGSDNGCTLRLLGACRVPIVILQLFSTRSNPSMQLQTSRF